MNVMFKKVTLQGLEYWICTLNGQEIARALSQEGVKHQVICLIRKNQDIDKEICDMMIKLT